MKKEQIEKLTKKQLEKLSTRLLVTITKSKYLGKVSERAKEVLHKRNIYA